MSHRQLKRLFYIQLPWGLFWLVLLLIYLAAHANGGTPINNSFANTLIGKLAPLPIILNFIVPLVTSLILGLIALLHSAFKDVARQYADDATGVIYNTLSFAFWAAAIGSWMVDDGNRLPDLLLAPIIFLGAGLVVWLAGKLIPDPVP